MQKADLQFPVERIARYLKVGQYTLHVGSDVLVLELAGNTARDNKKNCIIPRHIQLAVKNDEELASAMIFSGGVVPNVHLYCPKSKAEGDQPHKNSKLFIFLLRSQ
ncbi:hypothetical protein ZIOFF_026724 [Zingiber officinale]|uniref:Histone H2A n=1 Tax=Zingiber officinale TaxID=94328 RepID=A0A8J5H580_ZINOF|nr:hypothetical protein ZIOFF_026724 [Zingiber officinale]